MKSFAGNRSGSLPHRFSWPALARLPLPVMEMSEIFLGAKAPGWKAGPFVSGADIELRYLRTVGQVELFRPVERPE
jgi:hypothetical protein